MWTFKKAINNVYQNLRNSQIFHSASRLLHHKESIKDSLNAAQTLRWDSVCNFQLPGLGLGVRCDHLAPSQCRQPVGGAGRNPRSRGSLGKGQSVLLMAPSTVGHRLSSHAVTSGLCHGSDAHSSPLRTAFQSPLRTYSPWGAAVGLSDSEAKPSGANP